MIEHYQRFHNILNRIHPINAEDSSFLFSAFEFQKIKKEEFFTQAGETPKRIGIILKGIFRYYYITHDGIEHNKHFCSENQFIVSYSAAIRNTKSPFYIQALEKSEILSASFDDFMKKNDALPFGQIASRKMAEAILAEKIERESDLLLLDAKERYKKFTKKNPHLINRINQYQIASYLGITPESLSRIRKSFIS